VLVHGDTFIWPEATRIKEGGFRILSAKQHFSSLIESIDINIGTHVCQVASSTQSEVSWANIWSGSMNIQQTVSEFFSVHGEMHLKHNFRPSR